MLLEGFGDCGDFARLEDFEDLPVPEGSGDLFATSASSAGSYRCPSDYPTGPIHFAARLLAACCFAMLVVVGT